MTFYALGFAFLFVLACIVLLFRSIWPRHRDGRYYSMDEFTEMTEKLPETDPDGRLGKIMFSFVVLLIASIGVALGGRS